MPGQRGGFQAAASRFLMPVQACEFQLTQIIENLTRDPWPVANDRRPMRCTGVAMNVAVSMLEVSIRFEQVAEGILLRISCTVVRLSQHWRANHALCRRTCHRRPWDGGRTGAQRAYPIASRYRSRQRQTFQEGDQGTSQS